MKKSLLGLLRLPLPLLLAAAILLGRPLAGVLRRPLRVHRVGNLARVLALAQQQIYGNAGRRRSTKLKITMNFRNISLPS